MSAPGILSAADFDLLPKVEHRPCRRCKQVMTLMGGTCDPCQEVERVKARVMKVQARTYGLRKSLDTAGAPRVGSPEYSARVPAAKLRGFAERYSFDRGNVVIIGQSGTGKTTAVNALVLRLADEAIEKACESSPVLDCYRTTGLRIARSLREAKLGAPCEELEAARRARLLLLDEIGQELADPRWLLELVEDRYSPRPLHTITTSGLTREELEKRYGVGAVRRLVEPTGTVIDLFGGTA